MDEISYQKLLTTRICDLELNIEESFDLLFQTAEERIEGSPNPFVARFLFRQRMGMCEQAYFDQYPFLLSQSLN